jgi:hypothetical protein
MLGPPEISSGGPQTCSERETQKKNRFLFVVPPLLIPVLLNSVWWLHVHFELKTFMSIFLLTPSPGERSSSPNLPGYLHMSSVIEDSESYL